MSPPQRPSYRIEMASPCGVSWAAMSGDERKRRCGECKLDVHNLSAMTLEEIDALFQARAGRVCVRFYCRPDGTILTQDCPVGWRAVYRRIRGVAASAVAALAMLAGALWPVNMSAFKRPAGRRETPEPRVALPARSSPVPEPRAAATEAAPKEPERPALDPFVSHIRPGEKVQYIPMQGEPYIVRDATARAMPFSLQLVLKVPEQRR